jgi:hypothetical protein
MWTFHDWKKFHRQQVRETGLFTYLHIWQVDMFMYYLAKGEVVSDLTECTVLADTCPTDCARPQQKSTATRSRRDASIRVPPDGSIRQIIVNA